jgi:hypothetical protein
MHYAFAACTLSLSLPSSILAGRHPRRCHAARTPSTDADRPGIASAVGGKRTTRQRPQRTRLALHRLCGLHSKPANRVQAGAARTPGAGVECALLARWHNGGYRLPRRPCHHLAGAPDTSFCPVQTLYVMAALLSQLCSADNVCAAWRSMAHGSGNGIRLYSCQCTAVPTIAYIVLVQSALVYNLHRALPAPGTDTAGAIT